MLSLSDVINFGKFKGSTVSEVFSANPTYLCWYRDERRSKGRTSDLDINVHALLDEYLLKNRGNKTAKFKIWNYKGSLQIISQEEETKSSLAAAVEAARAAKAQEEAELETLCQEVSVSHERNVSYGQSWDSW